LVNQE